MKRSTAMALSLLLAVALSACARLPAERSADIAPNDPPIVSGENRIPAGEHTPAAQDEQGVTAVATTRPSAVQSSGVDRAEAINIALRHAGLTKTEVRELEAELDKERHGIYWEIDFEHGSYDYSYDIDLHSGEIVRSEREWDR